ncbi:hypothetical protein KKH14_00260 [Patescibacteria group bacterium]|nr:hypothetical protein [Patescibacteria group bacterium]
MMADTVVVAVVTKYIVAVAVVTKDIVAVTVDTTVAIQDIMVAIVTTIHIPLGTEAVIMRPGIIHTLRQSRKTFPRYVVRF